MAFISRARLSKGKPRNFEIWHISWDNFFLIEMFLEPMCNIKSLVSLDTAPVVLSSKNVNTNINKLVNFWRQGCFFNHFHFTSCENCLTFFFPSWYLAELSKENNWNKYDTLQFCQSHFFKVDIEKNRWVTSILLKSSLLRTLVFSHLEYQKFNFNVVVVQ